MVLTDKEIKPIKVLLKNALMDEWKAQGHYMSGKIVEDIEYEIERTFGSVSIVGKMYAYGGYIDQGVDAGRIPFNPGSGARHSKYIEGLIGFVQKKMSINDLKMAKSVAFAIAHTQKRQGMPTIGSYKFSNTGRRTDWINEALSKNMDEIGRYIKQFYAEYMKKEFNGLITTYSKMK